MADFLMTLAALALMLLTIRGLMRRSRLAIGFVVGCTLAATGAVLGWPRLSAGMPVHEVPLWLPPLPFAIVAIFLFGSGLVAWFLSED